MKQTNGSLDCADFQRSTVVSLSVEDRKGTLRRLQSALLLRMSSIAEHYDFFAEAQNVVEELKKLGFDLWSWGYDGEAEEIWGWDYVAKTHSGELIVEFRFPGDVVVRWGEDEPDGRHF